MITLFRTSRYKLRARRVTVAEDQSTAVLWGYRFSDESMQCLTFIFNSDKERYTVQIDAGTFNAGLPTMMAAGLGHGVIDPATLARAIMASPNSAAVLAELKKYQE